MKDFSDGPVGVVIQPSAILQQKIAEGHAGAPKGHAGAPKVQVESIAIEKQALVQNSALIRVAFSIIGNTKRAYVNVETNGDQARFRVLKVLLDSPQLKAISRADFKMRQWLYKESIPFDMGTMLVSMKKIANIVNVLNEYRDVTRPTLIADFKAAYPELLKTAEQALGDEFNASQFVSVDKVESEFSSDYKILGFEVPGSLKNVSATAYQAEVEKAAAKIQSVTHEIEQAQRTLLLSLIDTLDDKLSEDKIPTQRAIEKLQKFLADFSLNDITNDVQAAKLVEDLKLLTQGISAKGIKGNVEFQAELTSKIISAQKSLEGMVEARPARKIKQMDDDD
jgi:hypothetical protein